MTTSSNSRTASIVNEGGSYYVTPRALTAAANEEVRFRLVGPVGTTRLFFPNRSLFDKQVVTLDAKTPSSTLTVQDDVGTDVYPYAVYNLETKQFVRATPDPVIITE